MDTAKTPEVDNQWPANKLNARRIVTELEGVPHVPSGIAFYADVGLPWIEVHYGDIIVQPDLVVPIGRAIERAVQETIDVQVLFQALRPSSICYVIDAPPGWLTDDKNAPFLRAEEYGVLLDELRKGWKGGG